MSTRRSRSAPGDRAFARQRLDRANGFWGAAEALNDLGEDGNSIASLYVNCGIAASDALCCVRLGEYSQGESHADALALLKLAEPRAVPSLQRLLSRKSEAAYGGGAQTPAKIRELRNAALKLVGTARAAVGRG